MSQAGVAKGPSDQKTLNEELIEGLVEVARRNPQHAVELFGVSLGVAMRLAAMPDAQLDDLATTPAALWRPALTERLVRRLPERRPMLTPDHEVYRPLVQRINRLALAAFVRYADDAAIAALVCEITDPEVIRALQELPAFAFLEWGGNPGTLLAVPRLGDALIDRLLRADDDGVEPGLRGLLALTQCCEQEFALIRHAVVQEGVACRAAQRAAVGKRSGRPPANFLMPGTSSLILAMLRHQMRPTEVEDRMLATSDVRAAQLRGIAEALNPKPKRDKGAPRDRTRDHRDLWGSAHRRLSATAIFRLQRRLVDSGVEAFEAMVWAYDYYACTYEADCGVSLSRMLKDVFTPMREGTETHLSHCAKCGVVHLAHEEKSGIIECPVCVLARAGKYGQRRARVDKGDVNAMHDYRGWPGSTAWPMSAGDASRG
ncbi:MAG: hypothetical protein ABJD97_10475 [Betaproteobacteria bacterium]